MPGIALVLISIGERIDAYRAITEPFWRQVAKQLGAELFVLTERLDPARKHAGWQKLLLPAHFAGKVEYVIYADVDILPNPATPLDCLLKVPVGKIGMCAATGWSTQRPGAYYARALGLPHGAVKNITTILNSGVIVWRTSGSERLQALFSHIYLNGKQHCGEQTSLSCAVQQEGVLHLLPAIYNTSFIRAKPFPFDTFFFSRTAQKHSCFHWLTNWSDNVALRRLLSRPCFLHFVGGIFLKPLEKAASMLTSGAAEMVRHRAAKQDGQPGLGVSLIRHSNS